MRKINNKILLRFFASFFVLMSIGCVSVKPIYYEDDKKAAQNQVEKFHQLFNDEKYEEMYKMMSQETQKVITQEQFIKPFQKLRSEVGKVKQSKVVKSEVKPEAAFRVVELAYETEFERGKLLEKFSCLTDGENTFIDIYEKPTEISPNPAQ